jgi:hypothetical protein
MWGDCEQMRTGYIHTTEDEGSTDMTLVFEEHLLEHGHGRYDARLTACGEGMEFDIGGDEGSGEFGVGCCTSATTADVL